MKKLLLISLCIVLACCIFTGCRRSEDPQDTTKNTTEAVTEETGTAPQATTPATDNTMPSINPMPDGSEPESTEPPSTISPTGGVDDENNTDRSRHRSMGGRG